MSRTRVKITGEPRFRGSNAEALVRRAARAAFGRFKLPFDLRVDITLTGNRQIRRINARHRNADKPTDVLSFPMQRFWEGCPQFDPDAEAKGTGGRVFAGDIVLSLEKAREQAHEYGHSFARECAYLTVHSALHLVGFDHDTPDRQARMRREEECILKGMGLAREHSFSEKE